MDNVGELFSERAARDNRTMVTSALAAKQSVFPHQFGASMAGRRITIVTGANG